MSEASARPLHGLAERADLLITTDPHLLNITELKTLCPSQYR